MSTPQARITDFFTLRKRSAAAEPPSKRRKVLLGDGPTQLKKLSPVSGSSPLKLPLTPIKAIPDKYKLDLTAALSSKLKKSECSNALPEKKSNKKKNEENDARPLPGTPSKSSLSSPKPGTPSKAPLSPLEIKKRIGQVRKLSELQARLREISSPEKRQGSSVGSSSVMKELKFTMPSLVHSPKKKVLPPASPSKRPIPAHLKHLNLTGNGLLPLPKSYKRLLTVFSAMDQIISLRNNRGECIRLEEILGPVQNVVRSEVTLKHIEQVRCVFPGAFKFFWDKKRGRYGNVSDDYELLVVPSDEAGEALCSMTPLDLVKRKTLFGNSLLGMTKDLHAKFLFSVDPTIKIESDKIARWHKDFNPDEFCPEVDVLRLPEKPEVHTLHSVSDAMRETNKLFHGEDRLAAPSNEESSSSLKSTEQQEAEDEEAAFQEALKNRFKGINPSLVKKILAKEKIKMEKDLLTDKSKVEEKRQLDQLFDVARFLRSTFITEKKVALRMDFLLPRLLKSFSFGSSDMIKMIQTISQISPTFLKLINIRKTEYAKLDKNVSLALVETSINNHKNK
eukprot:TRINITY_DN4187_c0_g1_i1.p1 TRINITY_DN4187_c0_g1~~TRINITY_DN4187_c0_g1_i1.p1  ORF type:complete len:563 (-),score=205.99 TRINITY_DN4187_c0_g1_i1:2525-4213(-)